MRHPHMEDLARAFHGAGVATLRFQFPFLLGPRRRPPGPPPLSVDAFLDAAGAAAGLAAGRPVLFGGHSFGARVAALASAAPGAFARGVVALSFPLHPPRSADASRFAALAGAGAPAIVFQGERDPLGTAAELDAMARKSGGGVLVRAVEQADHGLQAGPRARESRGALLRRVALELAGWAAGPGPGRSPS